MGYVTMTVKGQITLPVEIRRALDLLPGKKLNISLEGEGIRIRKPENIDDVRGLLQAEMAGQGTGEIRTEGGDGWTAHAEEHFGRPQP